MPEANRVGETAAHHGDGGLDRPCVKVDALRQTLGTQGAPAPVQGHWGDDGSQRSIRSWNFKSSALCRDLEASPVRPMASPLAQPDCGTPCTGHSASLCLGVGKQFWIEIGLVAPEGPEGFKDFALGVEPRMSGGTDVAERTLIKIPDRTLLAFGGLEEGAIADSFQKAIALVIELFKAQGLVVTGLVADGQATVAGELGKIFETIGILNEGDPEMGADDADARDGAQVLDFLERATGLEQESAGLVLG